MPEISLVISSYNREKYIAAAIGSVLRQTRPDFELVVWDDGSSDGTVEAARRAAGDDPRVRVIAAEHSGNSRSINSAAKLLNGKYFGWVDSDDAIMPTTLAETAAVLDASPHVGVVFSNYMMMDESGRISHEGHRTKIPYSRDRLLIDFMTFQFRLMRREVFDEVGGLDPVMDFAEDYDLCLRLSEITNFQHLPRPLYLYRQHPNSVSHEHRLKQIMLSKEAIARALKRRGMDDQFEIEIELIGKFKLRQKEKP